MKVELKFMVLAVSLCILGGLTVFSEASGEPEGILIGLAKKLFPMAFSDLKMRSLHQVPNPGRQDIPFWSWDHLS